MTTTTESLISIRSERAKDNPNLDRGSEMAHWAVTLSYEGRTLRVPFSQGAAYGSKPPELNAVVDCLCSDAAGAGEVFEDWARDLGYDIDSRKARAIWRTVRRQTAGFKRLLGEATFDAMVYGRSIEEAVSAALSGPGETTHATSTGRHLRRVRYTGASTRVGRYCTLEVELRADGELSLCGTAGRLVAGAELYESGGQIREELAQWFPEVAGWFPWHLNHLNAGCQHQEALGWGHGRDVALDRATMTAAQVATLTARNEAAADHKREAARKRTLDAWTKERKSFHDFITRATGQAFISTTDFDDAEAWRYGLATGHPVRRGALLVGGVRRALVEQLNGELDHLMREAVPGAAVVSEVFRDSLMAPCPECGYAYGSAWLKRELPAAIRAEVEAFIATGALPGKGGA
jgi:hypothetical protein